MLIELKADMLKTAPQGSLIGIPVNTVGVGGKGLALWLKLAHPLDYKVYTRECRRGRMASGELIVSENSQFKLAFLPTKYYWANPSDIDLIDKTLERLKDYMEANFIEEVHVPRLGCGKFTGSLDWETDVYPLFVKHFGMDSECPYTAYVYDWRN